MILPFMLLLLVDVFGDSVDLNDSWRHTPAAEPDDDRLKFHLGDIASESKVDARLMDVVSAEREESSTKRLFMIDLIVSAAAHEWTILTGEKHIDAGENGERTRGLRNIYSDKTAFRQLAMMTRAPRMMSGRRRRQDRGNGMGKGNGGGIDSGSSDGKGKGKGGKGGGKKGGKGGGGGGGKKGGKKSGKGKDRGPVAPTAPFAPVSPDCPSISPAVPPSPPSVKPFTDNPSAGPQPRTSTPVTQDPAPAQGPTTEAPVTQQPITQVPATQAPGKQLPKTKAPVSKAPVTKPPVTKPQITQPPITQPPITQPPITQPPISQPPVTQPPVTQPPLTIPPTTPTPTTQVPDTKSPKTPAPIRATRAPSSLAPRTRAPTPLPKKTQAPVRVTKAPDTQTPIVGPTQGSVSPDTIAPVATDAPSILNQSLSDAPTVLNQTLSDAPSILNQSLSNAPSVGFNSSAFPTPTGSFTRCFVADSPVIGCPDADVGAKCDKFNPLASFTSCLATCIDAFCCIHDSGSKRAPSCSQEKNCVFYEPCYIVWFKLHDTIGPAPYLRLDSNEAFYDVDAAELEQIFLDRPDFFDQFFGHHFLTDDLPLEDSTFVDSANW